MRKENETKKDRVLRYAAIGTGILTGVLFIVSLISYIHWPGIFKPLAYVMIGVAVVFLVLRSVMNYRETFRVRERRRG